MSVWAVGMVKNEADVIIQVLDHLLEEDVDHILIADNLSTDGTFQMLQAYARNHPVTVVVDDEVAYHQSRKMTLLAERAAREGAEWIIPFDADEIWYGKNGRVADLLRHCTVDVVLATVFDHRPSLRSLIRRGDVFDRLIFRDAVAYPLPKVAFRYRPGAVIQQGNHAVENVGGACEAELLAIRHFPYRSFGQFAAKVRNGKRAYDATTLSAELGAHWRKLGARSYTRLLITWLRHHTSRGLVLDPAPIRRPGRR